MAPPFTSPQGNAPQTLAALWCLVSVAFLFVLLRLYTRFKVIDAIGVDDHLFNAAFILLVIYCVLITISAFYGFGLTRDDVPDPWHRSLVIILTNAGQTVVGLAVWVSKTSLAFFLLRIFGACGAATRWAIKLPPVALGLCVVAGLLAFWLECRPIAHLWDRLRPGVCGDAAVYLNLVASVLSFLCDFFYAALPWWTLRNIQIPPREKTIVLYSLSLGIFAGACGIMRAVELQSMSEGEYMRDRATLIIWHAAELTVTMVAIGIPVSRPLWKGWVTRFLPAAGTSEAQQPLNRSAGSSAFSSQGPLTIGGSPMLHGRSSKQEGPHAKPTGSSKGVGGGGGGGGWNAGGWKKGSHKGSKSALSDDEELGVYGTRYTVRRTPTVDEGGVGTHDSWASWSR